MPANARRQRRLGVRTVVSSIARLPAQFLRFDSEQHRPAPCARIPISVRYCYRGLIITAAFSPRPPIHPRLGLGTLIVFHNRHRNCNCSLISQGSVVRRLSSVIWLRFHLPPSHIFTFLHSRCKAGPIASSVLVVCIPRKSGRRDTSLELGARCAL